MNRSAEQIAENWALHGSRDLFVPRSNSFPMEPVKRNSFTLFLYSNKRILLKMDKQIQIPI